MGKQELDHVKIGAFYGPVEACVFELVDGFKDLGVSGS